MSNKNIIQNIATISFIGIVAIILTYCVCSCTKSKKDENEQELLVKVGKATLSRNDLDKSMPSGLLQEDSIKYARAFINTWINNQLLRQMATSEIDMTEIDKMVQQYRDELIMLEYSRQMYESHSVIDIPEDSIKSFYEENKQEFILTRPMIKGVYIKAADDSKELSTMKRLILSKKPKDIDNLDKAASNNAVHYEYFRDKWIDWEQIETRLPFDFGPNPDTFLKSNKSVDYSQGGFTYLLEISDVLHTGQIMPYESARNQIIDRLKFRDRRSYDEKLKRNLYENAKEAGKISIFCNLGE